MAISGTIILPCIHRYAGPRGYKGLTGDLNSVSTDLNVGKAKGAVVIKLPCLGVTAIGHQVQTERLLKISGIEPGGKYKPAQMEPGNALKVTVSISVVSPDLRRTSGSPVV